MSGSVDWHDQMGWLAVATASLLVAGFAMVSWLLAGLRRVHLETAELLGTGERVNGKLRGRTTSAGKNAGPVSNGDFVVVENMTRVHRPTCQFVRGKGFERITAAEVDQRGLSYCGVCCG